LSDHISELKTEFGKMMIEQYPDSFAEFCRDRFNFWAEMEDG
jgi:hypothetical protein